MLIGWTLTAAEATAKAEEAGKAIRLELKKK